MKNISIAIDGPAAAGKSTVAKRVADFFNYIYVDTGAMYRALTYEALNQGINLNNEDELANLLMKTKIELKPSDEGQQVLVNGKSVTEEIRSQEVTINVSTVAQHANVRAVMVKRQKEMGENGGVVMDGRDIGTQVLPNAELKIFLLASVDERAKRRHEENMKKGRSSDFEEIKREIEERDKQDSNRAVAPLKKAEDAILIDTTSLSIDDVTKKITELAKERV